MNSEEAKKLRAAASKAVAQALAEFGLSNHKRLQKNQREAVEERALEILREILATSA